MPATMRSAIAVAEAPASSAKSEQRGCSPKRSTVMLRIVSQGAAGFAVSICVAISSSLINRYSAAPCVHANEISSLNPFGGYAQWRSQTSQLVSRLHFNQIPGANACRRSPSSSFFDWSGIRRETAYSVPWIPVYEEAHGFPLPCLRYGVLMNLSNGGFRVSTGVSTGLKGPGLPLGGPNNWRMFPLGVISMRIVPIGLVPLGVLVDSAFFAALTFMGAKLCLSVRRALRRRRGACANCCYPVTGLQEGLCPECGVRC